MFEKPDICIEILYYRIALNYDILMTKNNVDCYCFMYYDVDLICRRFYCARLFQETLQLPVVYFQGLKD